MGAAWAMGANDPRTPAAPIVHPPFRSERRDSEVLCGEDGVFMTDWLVIVAGRAGYTEPGMKTLRAASSGWCACGVFALLREKKLSPGRNRRRIGFHGDRLNWIAGAASTSEPDAAAGERFPHLARRFDRVRVKFLRKIFPKRCNRRTGMWCNWDDECFPDPRIPAARRSRPRVQAADRRHGSSRGGAPPCLLDPPANPPFPPSPHLFIPWSHEYADIVHHPCRLRRSPPHGGAGPGAGRGHRAGTD